LRTCWEAGHVLRHCCFQVLQDTQQPLLRCLVSSELPCGADLHCDIMFRHRAQCLLDAHAHSVVAGQGRHLLPAGGHDEGLRLASPDTAKIVK
jgi:hypothetical protein